MSILFITQEYSTVSAGGAGVYAYELVQALAKSGIHVHVMAPGDRTYVEDSAPSITIHWQKVIRLPLLQVPSFHLQVALKARGIIERYSIKSIHSNHNAGLFAPTRLPLIATIHHLVKDELAHASWLQRVLYFPDVIFERLILKKAQLVVAVSHSVGKSLANLVPAEKLLVVPNGIDTEIFKSRPRKSVRADLGIQDGETIMFFPGGARAKRKGGLDFVRALQGVGGIKYRCIISGNCRELGWNIELQRAVTEAGLQDRFIWLGEIDYAKLPDIYSAADIIVYPSTFEGFGLPVLEALACERPLICTSTGEAPLIIRNNVNGLLVDVRNVDMLKDSLKLLIESKTVQANLAKHARKSVAAFSWAQVAKNIAALHSKLQGVSA